MAMIFAASDYSFVELVILSLQSGKDKENKHSNLISNLSLRGILLNSSPFVKGTLNQHICAPHQATFTHSLNIFKYSPVAVL